GLGLGLVLSAASTGLRPRHEARDAAAAMPARKAAWRTPLRQHKPGLAKSGLAKSGPTMRYFPRRTSPARAPARASSPAGRIWRRMNILSYPIGYRPSTSKHGVRADDKGGPTGWSAPDKSAPEALF